MRPYRSRSDIGFGIVVSLIVIELLKVLFIPNPFDVIVLGGLIAVLIYMSRS